MNEDRATRYHRLKRRGSIAATFATVVLLTGMMMSGASAALAAWAEGTASGTPGWLAPTATICLYVLGLMFAHDVVRLPFDFYRGFALERHYGLSDQTVGRWVRDHLKGFVVSAALGLPAASLLYGCIRRWPDGWWLPSGALFALIIVGLANLGPVLLLPLFYRIKPLEHDALRRRLMALADRAGARVLGAYEWGLGAETKKANAALTGLGATRRILVSDTMLSEYSEDEIEVVLAHELAHHVHGDIWKGLIFESALILGGFFVASKALLWLVPTIGLHGPADAAGLPLLLLAAGGLSLLTLPLAYAMSRAYERKADRFALEITRNPAAFVSAMKRLGAQSLAEEHPSKIVQWLFYSHPPIRERIAAAKQFAG